MTVSALGVVTLVVPAVLGGNAASEPMFSEEITLVGDAYYATGGTAGLQAAYQAKGAAQAMRTIVAVLPIDTLGYPIGWDSVNGKLKVYDVTAGTEVSATTDLSSHTFKLLILSK